MKQGDVVSPLLFNAGLELAMGRWKKRCAASGLSIDAFDNLLNIRCADDLMIYATSLKKLSSKLISMKNSFFNITLIFSFLVFGCFSTNAQVRVKKNVKSNKVNIKAGIKNNRNTNKRNKLTIGPCF